MRLRHLFAVLAIVFPLGFVGCGKKEAAETPGPASQEVEGDVTKLIPNDAIGLLYVSSIDSLANKVRGLVGSIDPDAAAKVNVDTMLEDMPPFLRDNLDRTRPLAVAITFPEGASEPVPTMVIPTKDTAPIVKEIESQGGAKPATSGKYVAVTMGPQPTARGSAEIAKKAPAGDVGVRLDLGRLVTQFRPLIDREVFGKMEAPGGYGAGMPPGFGAMMKPMVQGLKSFIDSAEWLDLALRIDGTRVDIDVEFRVKEGSALAGKLDASPNVGALAGRLPKDFPLGVVLSADIGAFMKWAETFTEAVMAAVPADQRDAMLAQMRAGMEAYKFLGKEHVMAFGLGDAGVEVVTISSASDAKAYIAKSTEAATASASTMSAMGMRMEALPKRTIEGVEVSAWKMDMDFSKMMASGGTPQLPPEAGEQVQGVLQMLFGADGMRSNVAAVDGRVVTVMGNDAFVTQAIVAAKKSGPAPGVFGDSIRRAGGNPSFLLHIEGRELARQATTFAKKIMPPDQQAGIPTIPSGKPATIVVHVTGAGRSFRGGLSAEVGAIGELVKSISK